MLEAAKPADLTFVRDSWRKSARKSPGTHDWPEAAYDAFITARMDELLPRCRIHVARPDDWPDGVLGWVASEQLADRYCVHWAFTKEPFRRQGILARLIEAQQPRGARVFSTKSFHDTLKHYGFTHDRGASKTRTR